MEPAVAERAGFRTLKVGRRSLRMGDRFTCPAGQRPRSASYDALRLTDGLLNQPDPRGCVASSGLQRSGRFKTSTCASVEGFAGAAQDVVVSPDGRNVYVASGDDTGMDDRSSVVVFMRAGNGSLTRLERPAGCVASSALADCAVVPSLDVGGISITPDGSQLFTGGRTLLAFARNQANGALAVTGCWSPNRTFGCTPTPTAVEAPAWSRDGRLGFAIGGGGSEVVALSRDPATGTIRQRRDACASPAHTPACRRDPRFPRRAQFLSALAVAADDTVYVAAQPTIFDVPAAAGTPFAVVGFRVARSTGALVALRSGCVSVERVRARRQDRRLPDIQDLVFSAAGRLYASASSEILQFARNRNTGALRSRARLRLCAAPGPCRNGRAPLGGSNGLVLSPDSHHLYGLAARDSFTSTGIIATLKVER